jgi:hypothetical protein
METKVIVSNATSALGILLLTTAISLAGCASYSHSNVNPSDAANILQVGDEVEITRKSGSTEYIKIEEISDTAVTGSLLTNMFGRDVTIPNSDMASITLYTKDGRDHEQSAEIIGGILGLALFFSLL